LASGGNDLSKEFAMTMNRKPASVFHPVVAKMIEGRARHASRFVNGALRMLDDEALQERGMTRAGLSGDMNWRALV
jgi:hypothetical protein